MIKAETITSPANPLLKDVKRAAGRGELTAEGCCVAETFHLLEEAVRSRSEVPVVLAAESTKAAVETLLSRTSNTTLIVVPDKVLQGVSATETAQGVISLVRLPRWTAEDLFRGVPLLVVLDRLQDPGNAGTIVRAAEAFGAGGVLFLKGTVSPYNPKTLRASAGSLFRLPVLTGMPAEAGCELFQARNVPLLAAVPARPGTRMLQDCDLTPACGLVIGSEAHGVSDILLDTATPVSIPTNAVESLNAAMAAVVLLYEARRQRTAQP